jgi:acetyl-CoA acetyltransferase
VSDGAGAVIIASEDAVKKHNFTPLARVVSYFASGCDPSIMGIGKFIMKQTDSATFLERDLFWHSES